MKKSVVAIAAFILLGGVFALPSVAFAAPLVCTDKGEPGCFTLVKDTQGNWAQTQASWNACDSLYQNEYPDFSNGTRLNTACRYTQEGVEYTKFYAQNISYDAQGKYQGTFIDTQTYDKSGNQVTRLSTRTDNNGKTVMLTGTADQTNAVTKGLSGQDCSSFTGFFSCLITVPSLLIAGILQGFVDLLYWLLFGLVWLSASMLDFSTTLLVMNMGKFVNSSSAAGIQAAWLVVRDIANIGIIGGLIATAISTILQISNYSAQKWLAKLIIAAVLVNFSYFFAGAIIDSSNFLATAIYNDMVTTKDGCTPQTCTLTWRFMQTTNFQNLHDNLTEVNSDQSFQQAQSAQKAAGAATQNTNLGPWMTLLVDILSVVFELMTIFIFLSALALITGRFVALIFILITSPVGIAGTAIPGLSKYARQWWNILFAQAFFAPVFFILLNFSFRVLEGAKSGILAGASEGAGTQAMGIILTFLVTSTFMFLSLKTAKSMSAVGKEYFEPIYKGAEMLMGGSAKLYQSGLKAAGNVAGTETIGRAGVAAGEYYRDKIAPRGWIFGKRADQIPVVAALSRKLQGGLLTGLGGAKFGGKESYADTKKNRLETSGTMSEKQSDFKKEKKANAAIALADEKEKEVEAEEAKSERAEVPVGAGGPYGGTPEEKAPSDGGSGGGTSGGGASKGSAGALPSGATGGETASGGGTGTTPKVESGGSAPGGESPTRLKPAATREEGAGREGFDTLPQRAPLHADIPPLNVPDGQEMGSEEELGYFALENQRAALYDEDGKFLRLETPGEVLERTRMRPQDFVTRDEKTKKLRIKTYEELHEQYFGRITIGAHNADGSPKLDNKGNPVDEGQEGLRARMKGDMRGIIRVKTKS